MAYFMGIDLGTSSLKVLIIDENGNRKALAARDYRFDSPVNGYAEQCPSVWWDACCESIRAAIDEFDAPVAKLSAVSFSGQMHGCVFLDRDLQPIRPAILHCDARSGEQVRQIRETLGEARAATLLMNPVYTGFLLPSLLWVRKNEPQNYERIRYVMLPKDYLKLLLTGRVTSDYSDASATLAFDIEKLCWSREVLDTLELPLSIFPPCYGTDEPIGEVTAVAAQETGLCPGMTVVNGGGDQVMQAIGNGAIADGQATVNIGTSGQVCFQSNRPVKNPALSTNTFCAYQKNRWIVMGAIMSAGLSLHWFNHLFEQNDYRILDPAVEKIPPGSGGLIYLPYLMGERTPHMNPDLSGVLLGIQPNTGRYQIARAVMEGVTYALMQCIEVCGELGLSAQRFVASGGGARSAPWLQMQADVFNAELRVCAANEQASLGAAIAAGVGAGHFGSIQEGCETAVRYRDARILPDSARHKLYQEYYALYKETYQACRDVLVRATRLGRGQP